MHKMKVKFYEKLHNNNRRSHTAPPIFYFIICNPLSVPNKIFKSLLQNVQIYRNSLMKPQKKSAKPHTPPILKFISRPTYSPPVLGGTDERSKSRKQVHLHYALQGGSRQRQMVEDRGGKSVICNLSKHYLLHLITHNNHIHSTWQL